jgi:hypothetical protein
MPSSVVADMEYNDEKSSLRITYTSGAVYDYMGVPPEVFKEMKIAGSKGTFLNYMIKGKYRYKKIRQDLT